MNWNNIAENCCPKCGYQLNPSKNGYECQSPSCDFFIRSSRFEEMMEDMHREDARREMEGYGF